MKRIIFWNHERGTWQYDLMCLLIIAFIFLSPKTWFDNKDKEATGKSLSAVQASGQKNSVSGTTGRKTIPVPQARQ